MKETREETTMSNGSGGRSEVVARRLGKTNGAANCQLRKALRAGLLVRTERGRYLPAGEGPK